MGIFSGGFMQKCHPDRQCRWFQLVMTGMDSVKLVNADVLFWRIFLDTFSDTFLFSLYGGISKSTNDNFHRFSEISKLCSVYVGVFVYVCKVYNKCNKHKPCP